MHGWRHRVWRGQCVEGGGEGGGGIGGEGWRTWEEMGGM